MHITLLSSYSNGSTKYFQESVHSETIQRIEGAFQDNREFADRFFGLQGELSFYRTGNRRVIATGQTTHGVQTPELQNLVDQILNLANAQNPEAHNSAPLKELHIPSDNTEIRALQEETNHLASQLNRIEQLITNLPPKDRRHPHPMPFAPSPRHAVNPDLVTPTMFQALREDMATLGERLGDILSELQRMRSLPAARPKSAFTPISSPPPGREHSSARIDGFPSQPHTPRWGNMDTSRLSNQDRSASTPKPNDPETVSGLTLTRQASQISTIPNSPNTKKQREAELEEFEALINLKSRIGSPTDSPVPASFRQRLASIIEDQPDNTLELRLAKEELEEQLQKARNLLEQQDKLINDLTTDTESQGEQNRRLNERSLQRKGKIEELEQKIRELTEKLSNLPPTSSKKIIGNPNVLDQLQKSQALVESQRAQIKSFLDELENQKRLTQDLQQQFNETRQDYADRLKETILANQLTTKELNKTLQTQTQAIADLQKALQSLGEENTDLIRSKENLQTQLDTARQDLDSLQDTDREIITAKETQIAALNSQLETATRNTQRAQEALTQANTDHEQAIDQLKSEHKRGIETLREQLGREQARADQLQGELTTVQQKLQDALTQNTFLTGKIASDAKKHVLDLQSKGALTDEQQEELESLRSQLDDSQKLISDRNTEINSLLANIETQKNAIQKLKDNSTKATQLHEKSLKEKETAHQALISKLNATIANNTATVVALNEQINALRSENAELSQSKEALQSELATARQDLDSLQDTDWEIITAKETQIAALEDQIRGFEDSIAGKASEIAALNSQLETATRNTQQAQEALTQANTDHEQAIDQLKSEHERGIETLREQLGREQARADQLQGELTTIQQKLQDALTQSASLSLQLQTPFQKAASAEKSLLRTQLDLAEGEKTRLESEKEQLEKVLAEKAQAETQIREEFEGQLRTLQTQYGQELAQLKSQNADLLSQATTMTNQLKSLDELKDKSQKMQETITSLTESREAFKQDNDSFQKKVQQLTNEKAELDKEHKETILNLTNQKAHVEAQIKQLKTQIESRLQPLRKEIQLLQSSSTVLNEKLEDTQKENQSLIRSKKALERTITSLKSQIDGLAEQLQEAEESISDLSQDNTELKSNLELGMATAEKLQSQLIEARTGLAEQNQGRNAHLFRSQSFSGRLGSRL